VWSSSGWELVAPQTDADGEARGRLDPAEAAKAASEEKDTGR